MRFIYPLFIYIGGDMLTDGPWIASAPHPQTGAITIVNAQGRVVAPMIPSKADADFICSARDAYHMDVTVRVDWKGFGRSVQWARKEKRYSQEVAAEMCGISRNYMSMIERGTATDPSYTIVLTLCRWLRLELPQ
jgi:DNA-binding XRE family transcriptional regulator